MKNAKRLTIWTIIILSCLLMLTFAEDITKIIQAAESNARIIYNGKELSLGVKPYSIEGSNYLPVRASAVLFDKNIDWNQKEQKIIISDKPNAAVESLKLELGTKDKSIAELQSKVKGLENDAAGSKELGIQELQDGINNELSEYEEVYYRVILSGNEEEVRVKIEVDLSKDKSAWNRLNVINKKEMIRQISDFITGEYNQVKIKGYLKDISSSNTLLTFYNTYEGEIELGYYRNYSTISTLEDRFNNGYDDYFKNIHLTFALGGNENSIQYFIYIQKSRFEEGWDSVYDDTLKNFMKKLSSEIEVEYKGCHIVGYVYDTDSYTELAASERMPGGEFTFSRQ